MLYRLVLALCVVTVAYAHLATTKVFECQCWDLHTHAPTPPPRKYYLPLLPPPTPPKVVSHKRRRKNLVDKRGARDSDSYD